MKPTVEVKPCRTQNSIYTMGFIVSFSNTINLEVSHIDYFKESNFFLKSFDYIDFDKNQRGKKNRSIIFKKYISPDKPSWVIKIAQNDIVILHYDYRRWEYTWKLCCEFLKEIKFLYQKNDVSRIFLGYLDLFYVKDYLNFNYSMLYKKNKFTPELFFGENFSNFQYSFPIVPKNTDDLGKWIDIRLSAQPVRISKSKKISKFKLYCDTSASIFFEGINFENLFNDSVTINDYAHSLHILLKELIKDMLTDDMLKKIGIKV